MTTYLLEGLLIDTPEKLRLSKSISALEEAMRGAAAWRAGLWSADSAHNLYVDLGCTRGIIPGRRGALALRDGSTRDIAIISRVNKPVAFQVIAIDRQGDGAPRPIPLPPPGAESLYGGVSDPAAPWGHHRRTGHCTWSLRLFCRRGMRHQLPHPHRRHFGLPHLPSPGPVPCGAGHPGGGAPDGARGGSPSPIKSCWAPGRRTPPLFCAGETVAGIVRSVESYGIFVELSPTWRALLNPRENVFSGQHASVYIKSLIPEKMKVKLIIVDSFDAAYRIQPPRYFIEGGHISRWQYSPIPQNVAVGKPVRLILFQLTSPSCLCYGLVKQLTGDFSACFAQFLRHSDSCRPGSAANRAPQTAPSSAQLGRGSLS